MTLVERQQVGLKKGLLILSVVEQIERIVRFQPGVLLQ